MRFSTSFALALLLLTPPAFAAEDGIKVSTIKDGLHMIASPHGGNVVVSTGPDGVFLIDDQLEPHSATIRETVKGISGADGIDFILNTHYHFDHTGGNPAFGEAGAIIVAHDNVRKRLSSDQFISYFKKELKAMVKSGLPVVTFSNDVGLHYNNDDVSITHTPHAHTDGDAIAKFEKANVIVAGDVIFNGIYPFIDTEHGGSAAGIITALDKIIGMSNSETVIIPGHGPKMNVEDVKAYREMVATITGRIASLRKAGKTLAEIIATKPTGDYDAKVQPAIVSGDALVELIYNGMEHGTP